MDEVRYLLDIVDFKNVVSKPGNIHRISWYYDDHRVTSFLQMDDSNEHIVTRADYKIDSSSYGCEVKVMEPISFSYEDGDRDAHTKLVMATKRPIIEGRPELDLFFEQVDVWVRGGFFKGRFYSTEHEPGRVGSDIDVLLNLPSVRSWTKKEGMNLLDLARDCIL